MKKMTHYLLTVVLLLAVTFSGCGGGNNPPGGGIDQTKTIFSDAGLDGQVHYIMATPGTYDPNSLLISIGYTATQIPMGPGMPPLIRTDVDRGLLSFDLSTLAGKTITNAVLKVHVTPSTSPLVITVDHINYGTNTSNALDLFSNLTVNAAVGTMTAENEWRVLTVTNLVAADLSQGHTQYRLYIAGDTGMGTTESITIESGNSETNKPELVITYH